MIFCNVLCWIYQVIKLLYMYLFIIFFGFMMKIALSVLYSNSYNYFKMDSNQQNNDGEVTNAGRKYSLIIDRYHWHNFYPYDWICIVLSAWALICSFVIKRKFCHFDNLCTDGHDSGFLFVPSFYCAVILVQCKITICRRTLLLLCIVYNRFLKIWCKILLSGTWTLLFFLSIFQIN